MTASPIPPAPPPAVGGWIGFCQAMQAAAPRKAVTGKGNR